MKLLFVSKRQPQQRDLVTRPYGRFFHLPTELARLGHEVTVVVCSHRAMPSELFEREGVAWASEDIRTAGPVRFLATVDAHAKTFGPDWVVGCSDTWAGWLAHRLAGRLGCKLAIDAYDNYEAYMPWNYPLHWLWRRAVRAADLVTAAGPQLANRLDRSRHDKSSTCILPMCADPNFVPMDRSECRRHLGLPQDGPLFGYSGGWTRSRGSDLILDAFALVRRQQPEARLVLTGKPPQHAITAPGVINLGYVDDADMPRVTNAVDVACVVVADTTFGRFSYPVKLCEAMACGVPVAASATAAVSWMLDGDARFLARVGDATDHARTMLQNLGLHIPGYALPPTWNESARKLAEWMSR